MTDPTAQPEDRRREAEPLTRAIHAAVREKLDFAQTRDTENAARGLIAPAPDGGRIAREDGRLAWDLSAYAFLDGDAEIDTIHPSLLRLARLNMANGLFRVVEGVYQLRGMDLANMTVVEGETGVILIDCLQTPATAKAALELYYAHRGRRPVKALIYTHSHSDHYGGAHGVLDPAEAAAGRAAVIAPDGFMEALGGENVLAGVAMTRRAQFQMGSLVRPGPKGQVDAGLGKGPGRGPVSLIAPTQLIVEPVETHVIDGVEIVFHLAPGTEAPAEMHMYFPGPKVLNMAENATPLLHNFCPLRGSEVRDPRIWSHYLADAVDRFADRTEALICQHHWPTWGSAEIREFLERQRDLYKHIHDQTVRLMNLGWRPAEIAEAVTLPPSLEGDFRMRGYYGTVSHNVKAVFQRYLSWYDGNPANLDPLPPKEAARKYVDYMGGAGSVIEKAQADFDRGEYRWVAQVLYHVIFAEPDHAEARALAADAFEQLGYQAESATWRNAYLYGAQELRKGVARLPPMPMLSPDLLNAVSPDILFDFIAVRLDAAKAKGLRWVIDWQVTDAGAEGERVAQTLSNETLTQIVGKTAPAPDASARLSRATLVELTLARLAPEEAIAQGLMQVEGDASAVTGLFAMLDRFEMQFDVVTP
ncbi:MAG: alkyl/aryl-sulfatase [Albimonas sp.]|uniref:alkyl/aryl-sulfatase n=1 Tax=Albimonas sp. TaxID=1872425 RepID=UPI004056E8F0